MRKEKREREKEREKEKKKKARIKDFNPEKVDRFIFHFLKKAMSSLFTLSKKKQHTKESDKEVEEEISDASNQTTDETMQAQTSTVSSSMPVRDEPERRVEKRGR